MTQIDVIGMLDCEASLSAFNWRLIGVCVLY